jgi:hypothetical protein
MYRHIRTEFAGTRASADDINKLATVKAFEQPPDIRMFEKPGCHGASSWSQKHAAK